MTAANATTTSAASRRATLIKLIHAAKRELGQQHGLDDVAYRQILVSVGQDSSLKTMAIPGMVAVLEHLKARGFVVRPKAGDRRQAINPGASKVRALWLFLHQLGEVRDPSEKALAAYVKRIAKVDDLHWASGRATDTLIETLKKWAMRVLPGAIKALADEVLVRHRVQPFGALQLAVFLRAANASVNYEGFDHHLWAWQDLMELLGRPVGGVAQALEAKR
ncbi:regulatory protein GemA [Acidovorax sp.]|uniref:gp16 family protein n=1 Tax=Acidovorax sp. TaxID=1872122 RepID=UPI002ACD6C58|nr:regulatory protein GemA [Acidovorax sp.]MDZ7862413.1 regulatory protein GemA [Acidovorax sp.]